MNYTNFCFWLCGLFESGDLTKHTFQKIQYNLSISKYDSSFDNKSKHFVETLKGFLHYANTFELFTPHFYNVRNELINTINDITSVSSNSAQNILTRSVCTNSNTASNILLEETLK